MVEKEVGKEREVRKRCRRRRPHRGQNKVKDTLRGVSTHSSRRRDVHLTGKPTGDDQGRSSSSTVTSETGSHLGWDSHDTHRPEGRPSNTSSEWRNLDLRRDLERRTGTLDRSRRQAPGHQSTRIPVQTGNPLPTRRPLGPSLTGARRPRPARDTKTPRLGGPGSLHRETVLFV